MCVGVVTGAGREVEGLREGDEVFGHVPVRATHTLEARRLLPVPGGVSPQALMYSDPTNVAVGGVREAPVRLGDRVAVFGLGAIGQMTLQVARLAGASWVAAIDPIQAAVKRPAVTAPTWSSTRPKMTSGCCSSSVPTAWAWTSPWRPAAPTRP